ncbi:MAG: hypothetical protein MdMp024_1114 [Bacteroidales bacterium]
MMCDRIKSGAYALAINQLPEWDGVTESPKANMHPCERFSAADVMNAIAGRSALNLNAYGVQRVGILFHYLGFKQRIPGGYNQYLVHLLCPPLPTLATLSGGRDFSLLPSVAQTIDRIPGGKETDG